MFTIDNRPVPAFARGASGIALALGRLYKVSGQVKYLQAAREALWYENALLRLYNEALTRAARYFEDFAGFNEIFMTFLFFEGISGIGYVLLRLVERRLPSVLAFE